MTNRGMTTLVEGLAVGFGIFALVAVTMVVTASASVRPLDVLLTLAICAVAGCGIAAVVRRDSTRARP